MKPDYKNWVPGGMIYGFGAAAAGLTVAASLIRKTSLSAFLGAGALGCGVWTAWCIYANKQFSYHGERMLSQQIIEGTAQYITLPEGGVGLDVGCGSGALTIACAKRNPQGSMVGIDRWGPEYAAFCKELCEQNAQAEGVTNTRFQKGDACKLDFPDETFDAVTSNYVYHNITGKNKQELLDKIDFEAPKMSGIKAKIGALMAATRQYDMAESCRRYLQAHPNAAVVNLGCGLDTTFSQVDNGTAVGYHLDFPDVIKVRNELLPAKERQHSTACDLTDHSWFDAIDF